MGSGASGNSGTVEDIPNASADEIAAAVAKLSEADIGRLKAALATVAVGEGVQANKDNIRENKSKLHTLESVVWGNKQAAYLERAMIEENRALILKNYAAAFMGNRQLANQNTDDIFRNRRELLLSMKVDGQVQQNFQNSMVNEAKVNFLNHRSSLTTKVAATNEKMIAVNAEIEAINKMIMDANAEIVEFNSACIAENDKLITGISDGSITAANATVEDNAARIASNTNLIVEITARASSNKEKVETSLVNVRANTVMIMEDMGVIKARREEMEANHALIAENAQKTAAIILAT